MSEKLSTILLLAISFLPIWSWMTQYRLTNVPLGYLLFYYSLERNCQIFIFIFGKKWRFFFPYVKWVFSTKICHFWTNKCFEKGKNIVSNRMFSLVPILTIYVFGPILNTQREYKIQRRETNIFPLKKLYKKFFKN